MRHNLLWLPAAAAFFAVACSDSGAPEGTSGTGTDTGARLDTGMLDTGWEDAGGDGGTDTWVDSGPHDSFDLSDVSEDATDAGELDGATTDAATDAGPDASVGIVTTCGHGTAGDVQGTFEVTYYTPGAGWPNALKAHVWIPDPVEFPGKRPGIVMLHGGCTGPGDDTGGGCYSTFWKDGLGNEKDGPFWAGRGYVAVAVQYRYPQNYFAVAGSEAPEDDLAKLPAPVQDMRCGIRWMRATAEHGLDRLDDERIFAYGGSGGGMWSLTMLAESGRGVDLAWYDNPACPYNDASTLPGGADTASVQGAVAGFPRVDDRPEYLDRTAPDGWPPKHPSDWVGQNGEKFRSNYWMKQLKDTLNHMFGAKDFPDVYAADANVKDRVDRIAVILKAKAAWGPVFIKHSVFDDLNYYQGTVDLVSALKAAGHPEHLRTVIPVSRAWCAPPLPKGTPKALRSTLECSGHDDMPLYGSWDGDDPVDEMDLNNDGEPDYDSLASFCTLKRFLEVHHPAGRPVHVPADWD